MSHFNAVIFDMDGLMLDTEPIYRRVWQTAAAELGHIISDDMYATFIGRPTEECRRSLSETFGPQFPHAPFRKRSRELWQAHVGKAGIAHKPGLPELLALLEARHIPKAVATSTVRKDAIVCLGELASRFDAIVTGDEVRHGKPAPDIFLLTAQRLNVAPESCLVLEDSEAGATGALAANMSVIIVPDLKIPGDELAARTHRVCKSLHEVRAVFEAK